MFPGLLYVCMPVCPYVCVAASALEERIWLRQSREGKKQQLCLLTDASMLMVC